MTKTIACVVGARPNFMKVAPILRQIERSGSLESRLIHTGQHYDSSLSGQFFEELEIRAPDANLDVGSGSHAVQTAHVMEGMDRLLDAEQPDAVLVVGDVNSTLASALVATKKHIRVIHVESGLRSFDRAMPEEINRIVTDQISDLLFVTEQSGVANLLAEGIAADKIELVGNVMIDSLFHARPKAIPASETFGKADGGGTEEWADGYALLTLHRPANVDDHEVLKALLTAIAEIAKTIPVWFPVHPKTRKAIEDQGLQAFTEIPNMKFAAPASYHEMIGLLQDATLVLTDSGGLQEESSALGIPCFTLRESTERPVTVDVGTNIIVGNAPEKLLTAFGKFQAGKRKTGKIPPLWDGRAAERIVERIENWI